MTKFHLSGKNTILCIVHPNAIYYSSQNGINRHNKILNTEKLSKIAKLKNPKIRKSNAKSAVKLVYFK
ncbi:hypothetical protein [Citrobacter rodentium]|uniref:Uncharacterized protein n=1 Tax=Citrobacter rodentium TaxID=67825 RepID=A0A482PUU1_CITRO|nr:hypothetical protein E2R62_21405 [Citrobacter rodentium]HAT8012379.1 hypothetical protein [Citrobacter rodentium NBRC 105723 = DSM 16636]HAT8017430.1 hypothetical protein [Citrobacter rodentium]